MSKFNWNYPTTMWVGHDRVRDLNLACKSLSIRKPLLVTDNDLVESDIVQNTLKDLKNKDIDVQVFSNVIGNPTGSNVNEGVEFFKKKIVMV